MVCDPLAERLPRRDGLGVRLANPGALGALGEVAFERLLRAAACAASNRDSSAASVTSSACQLAIDLGERRLALVEAVADQRLEPLAQPCRALRAPASGFDRRVHGVRRRRGRPRRRLGLGVDRAHQRARPLGRRLVLRPLRHLVEQVARRQPLDGRERHVLVLASAAPRPAIPRRS